MRHVVLFPALARQLGAPPPDGGSPVQSQVRRDNAGGTIADTDDELAGVTAVIRRAIEDDRFARASTPCAPRSQSSIPRWATLPTRGDKLTRR